MDEYEETFRRNVHISENWYQDPPTDDNESTMMSIYKEEDPPGVAFFSPSVAAVDDYTESPITSIAPDAPREDPGKQCHIFIGERIIADVEQEPISQVSYPDFVRNPKPKSSKEYEPEDSELEHSNSEQDQPCLADKKRGPVRGNRRNSPNFDRDQNRVAKQHIRSKKRDDPKRRTSGQGQTIEILSAIGHVGFEPKDVHCYRDDKCSAVNVQQQLKLPEADRTEERKRERSGTPSPSTATPAFAQLSVKFLYVLALACVVFVPVWKIIDTSYLFREKEDPSMFDRVTDYFSYDESKTNWLFVKFIDNGKDTYRVYFFIMPFCLGFLLLSVMGTIQKRFQIAVSPKRRLPSFLQYRPQGIPLSIMDLILITATLVYSAILVWARMKRSMSRGAGKLTFLYQDSKEPLNVHSNPWETVEILALTFGVLTITVLGWFVLMPIGRRSVLLELFGIPREVALKYHRWLGWYTLGVLLAHMFLYIAVWVHADGHPIFNPKGGLLRHMTLAGSCNDGSCDDDTERLHVEAMYGYASLGLILLLCLTAINYVRRHMYELFFYTHQLFVPIIFLITLHYKKAPLYLLPGVTMILIDKTIGYLSFTWTVSASATCLTKDILELRVRKDPFVHCKAGQYVFVNVPSVSVLQWHPMTVTWATDDEVALHIRARGPRTWTQQLYDLVMFKDHIQVKLDGFYGHDALETYSLPEKEAVLFVGGGCGLTFPFSIILQLCQTNERLPVYLHWVTRSKQEYAAFQELISYATRRFSNLSISVWVTLKGHTKNDRGHFAKATVPESPSQDFVARSDIRHSRRKGSSLWRPFPSWLWSKSNHAFVTAVAIFAAVCGLAVSRNHQLRDSIDETRAMLVDRFLDLLIPMLFALSLLLVWVFVRVLPILISKLADYGDTLRRGQTFLSTDSSSSDSSQTSRHALSLDTIELGNAPHVHGIGQRPNFAEIFHKVGKLHKSNVAVFACGPRGLVNDVRLESQRRSSWVTIEEEWEW